MITEITLGSGSVMGIFGELADVISALGVDNPEQIEALTENVENFPIANIGQRTSILGEANESYNGVVDATDISYQVYRNNNGQAYVIILEGGGDYIYLPGTEVRISGSDLGGSNNVDDVVVILQPGNGLVFDTDNDYAILNHTNYEDTPVSDYGLKAQLMNNSYEKVGDSFQLEPKFSFVFNTTEQ
jgi:hypothetical protein